MSWILTFRDPSCSGVECRSRVIPNEAEARRLATHYAEIYGGCGLHTIASSEAINNSRGGAHAAPVREPEKIINPTQEVEERLRG